MNKSGPTAIKPVLARERHPAANAPEGLAASGKALGEVACLSPEAALQRLSSIAGGLTPDQVKDRLQTSGLNQVAHQARHTIFGELVGRSINPLNLLLLSLATTSYFLGDQRAAIVIAVMVLLSISLSFIQEHRSNNAADKLQRMVVPGDVVLLSAGDMIPADLRLISAKDPCHQAEGGARASEDDDTGTEAADDGTAHEADIGEIERRFRGAGMCGSDLLDRHRLAGEGRLQSPSSGCSPVSTKASPGLPG